MVLINLVLLCLLAGTVVFSEAAQPNYCSLPLETGPCRAHIQRYYFDTSTQECKQFIYGGCQGTENNFQSLSQCKAACICTRGYDIGKSCGRRVSRYFYDISQGVCKKFHYNGCCGNGNRFTSARLCLAECALSFCFLPPETGPCTAAFGQYFYNKTSQSCETFIYTGCGGNENRFSTIDDCNQRCTAPLNVEANFNEREATVVNLSSTIDICMLPRVFGTCKAISSRYFYNATSKICQLFIYSGCQGNANNFASENDCQQRCGVRVSGALHFLPDSRNDVTADDCQLPPDSGLCNAVMSMYFFDSSTSQCRKFIYGGCQGNRNRFRSEQDCYSACKKFYSQWENSTPALGSSVTGAGYYGPCSQVNPNFFLSMLDSLRSVYGLSPLLPSSPCRSKRSIPLNKCLLLPETGHCYATITKFYYDSQNNICRKFTYGGCGGNENKFATAEECQRACGNQITPPEPEDVCLLPADAGMCYAYIPRYSYNVTSGSCEQFIYGGCGGNGNNFKTVNECQNRCENSSTVSKDLCTLHQDGGPCFGNFHKFYYNATSGTCQEFIYGGCQGNDNRFDTVEECQKTCTAANVSTATTPCNLPAEEGPCKAYMPMFYYNVDSGKCEQFIYGGCQGNDNRFDNESECEEICSSFPAVPQNVCQLPPETGPCRASFPRFFYNATSKMCDNFTYGGCQGNGNRFETQTECEDTCRSSHAPIPQLCNLPADAGTCKAAFRKFHFNVTSGTCEEFIYGGCQGNDNRFDSQVECEGTCLNGAKGGSTVCLLPAETGPCDASIPKFHYNVTSSKCEAFNYGGCGGNLNRFDTRSECEEICSNLPAVPQDVCLLSPETGPCRASIRRFFYNATSKMCETFIYGGCEGNGNNFETLMECQDWCVTDVTPPEPEDVCLLPADAGMCYAYIPRYSYNVTSGSCEQFIYGGCGGNGNNFKTVNECQNRCENSSTVSKDLCTLHQDGGPCFGNFHKFYYNATSGTCQEFIYGGCQGNDNRFDTVEECQKTCTAANVSTATTPCNLPAEEGPCKAYMPMFYYNVDSGKCEQFIYGGCQGNDNRFDNESECEEICSSFPAVPQNVCQLPPETGPCRASFPRFFYNATSKMCDNFTYGGCQGNGNRFETQTECEDTCRSSHAPIPQLCNLPADAGTCKAAFRKFHFNVTSGTCEEFIYGGCQGNDNRFETKYECENTCSVAND